MANASDIRRDFVTNGQEPARGAYRYREQTEGSPGGWYFDPSAAGGGYIDPSGPTAPSQPASGSYLYADKAGGFDSLLRMYEQGQGGSSAIQDLLTNFKGTKEELADFLEIAGPLYGGLEAKQFQGSDAYKFFADKSNWDLGAMSGYGAAAGQIGRGTRQSQQQAGQGLAAMGFGRSSARGAVQSALSQQGIGQQANLRSQVQQQAMQNKANMAGQLMDANRLVAQMALGQQLTPRIQSPQGGAEGGAGALQGALAGAGAGAAFGPIGAIVGGLGGAALSM